MGWYWLIHSEYAFHAQRSLPTRGRNRPGVQMPDTQADAERMMEFIAGLRDGKREDEVGDKPTRWRVTLMQPASY